MLVTVSWVTSDPQEAVDHAMRYLDENCPSPVDWVSQGLHAGARTLSIPTAGRGLNGADAPGGEGFEILIEGPGEWRASRG